MYIDDFVNGFLDEELEMEFVAFLDQHPGIMDEETLSPQEFHLDDEFKNNLYRAPSIDNASTDELLIAELEGDLDPEQQEAFNKRVSQNPELQRDRRLYALTQLDPSDSISFPDKSSLKKRSVFILYRRWSVAAAAILVAGMAIFQWFHSETLPGTKMAELPGKPIQAEVAETTVTQEHLIVGESSKSPDKIIKSQLSDRQEAGEYYRYTRVHSFQTNRIPVALDLKLTPAEEPELQELKPRLVASIEEPVPSEQIEEQTLVQWVYKKLRQKVGAGELIVPENEIPRDVANIALAKVAPVFQYNPTTNTIKIGQVEINRRSTR